MWNMLLNVINGIVVDTPTNDFSGDAAFEDINNFAPGTFILGMILGIIIGIIICGIFVVMRDRSKKHLPESSDKENEEE